MSTRPKPRPSKVIFQPFRGRLLHRLLWKRLRLPRGLVHPALSAVKFAANPAQVRLRRRLARELGAASQRVGLIPPAKGYLRCRAGELPGLEEVVARCAGIFDEVREKLERESFQFNPNKRFLLSVLTGSEFCEHPDLIRFMVCRPILDTVTAYLGSVPLLAGGALWWTPVNESALSSQLYHFDNEDFRQVKLFVNVFETADEHGPFTFLPADVSQRIRESVGYVTGRVDDERALAIAGPDAAIQVVGPPGSAAFVDTARCLHFGSRSTRRDRLVLMIQFLRFHAPTESTFRFQVPPDLPGIHPDPYQRLALGIR